MAPLKKRRKKQRNNKNRHILFIFILLFVGLFFYFDEFERDQTPKEPPAKIKPEKKPAVIPEIPVKKDLPKVSIIIDDLGPSKKWAKEIFAINSPLTIAILPQQPYSVWIAEEAYKQGRDIILHLPMEATRPLKLGEGGLYTWMTDEEIYSTMNDDINSVPHIIGVSNHMGSAFTQDKRVMGAVLSELKKQNFFFLDSLTTAQSVAYKLAQSKGLRAFKRDVFLDNSNEPAEIEKQWNRMIKIARKTGKAIALGHPRKNTIKLLKDKLSKNTDILVVPITELR